MIRRAGLLLAIVAVAGCATTGGETNPKEAARINTQLGIEYLNQGQNDRAKDKLERALEQDSSYAPTHATLALLYSRMGRDADAKKHFVQALYLDPKDASTRNNFGAFLCGRNEAAAALAQFDQVLKNPEYTSPQVALTNAGVCARKLPDDKRAENYFRQAVERDPKYPEVLEQLALLNYDRRKYLPARAFLQRLEAQRSLDREQLKLAVRIERALGDERAALRYRETLYARFPEARFDSSPDQP